LRASIESLSLDPQRAERPVSAQSHYRSVNACVRRRVSERVRRRASPVGRVLVAERIEFDVAVTGQAKFGTWTGEAGGQLIECSRGSESECWAGPRSETDPERCQRSTRAPSSPSAGDSHSGRCCASRRAPCRRRPGAIRHRTRRRARQPSPRARTFLAPTILKVDRFDADGTPCSGSSMREALPRVDSRI
jgi:hypothetical protein